MGEGRGSLETIRRFCNDPRGGLVHVLFDKMNCAKRDALQMDCCIAFQFENGNAPGFIDATDDVYALSVSVY